MGRDESDDLTDDQRAALVALFDAIEHGHEGHAEAIAAGLDADADDADDDGTEDTDLHDPTADYGTDEP